MTIWDCEIVVIGLYIYSARTFNHRYAFNRYPSAASVWRWWRSRLCASESPLSW